MIDMTVNDLTAGYGRKTVIRDVSFSLEKGELAVLLGLNGSGKTTLLRTLAGLIKPFSGTVEVKGRNLLSLGEKERAKLVSYTSQRPGSPEGLTLLDMVLMGYNAYLPLLSQPSKAEKEAAIQGIAAVSLEDKTNEPFNSLSEGQKQLGVLARSLIQASPIMLMDEPERAMDYRNRILLLERIASAVKKSSKTALLTMHAPEYALRYADRILAMKDGRIIRNISVGSTNLEELEECMRAIYGNVRIVKYGSSSYTLVPEDEI